MTAQPASPLPDSALIAVEQAVSANAQARETLRNGLVSQVEALIREFTHWYDDLAVRRLAKEIAGMVASRQRLTASQEDAYLANLLTQTVGRTVPARGPVSVDHLRAGTTLQDAYERLAVQYRYQRSVGNPDPLPGVLDRAEVMNDMDVQLAARAQDRKVLRIAPRTVGYRRVIHPEFSSGGTCGLCIAATDRVYKADALLPIHGRCHCTVAPVLSDGTDPGASLNNLDLSTLYRNAEGSSSASRLKATRYRVDDHGELGPVLTPKRRGGGVVNPESPGAAHGLSEMTESALDHQIALTVDLKPSEWRTNQLRRLRAEKKRRATS